MSSNYTYDMMPSSYTPPPFIPPVPDGSPIKAGSQTYTTKIGPNGEVLYNVFTYVVDVFLPIFEVMSLTVVDQ
jgi:hypothetical protein